MNKRSAAIGSALFFAVAPGTVAALVPWLITGWELHDPLPAGLAWLTVTLRVLGVGLIVLGLPVLIQAFVRFVIEGIGTPAPVAPPRHLVVGGWYRHVRNPMYVAIFSAVIGQTLLFMQAWMLVYVVVMLIVVWSFVHFREEPVLRRRFGAEYDTYREHVPAWWPRLRGWSNP